MSPPANGICGGLGGRRYLKKKIGQGLHGIGAQAVAKWGLFQVELKVGFQY